MSDHTPGPWKYSPRRASILDERQVSICGIHGKRDKEVAKANARLISAAPEMYDALLSARVAVRELCEGQHPENECWETLARIDAALAKAGADR